MNHSTHSMKPAWPLALRLAGVWLIWSTWASATGWALSAVGQLHGGGYLLALPFLIVPSVMWWRHSSAGGWIRLKPFKLRGRALQWVYIGIALMSLAAALIYIPWSFDAVTYRLPRVLYWLEERQWYWIGTIDGRLDYSSCGLEWQMIPVMLLTQTDRCLFLLSYLPFLLLPGLTYLGGRTLGMGRRPMLIWMWLLPCAYCIVLQSSGLQNDGYTTCYTVACLAFAGVAIRRKDPLACALAGIAAALLTGAKLSNLPLMLPLGILFLVAACSSGFFKRPIAASLLAMAAVSFLPLAALSLKNTGNWTGDPNDQWGFRTGNPVAATLANLILAANDMSHPPVMVGTGAINSTIERGEKAVAPLMDLLHKSHPMFGGIQYGDLVYEGGAGPGFSIGLFLIGGLIVGFFIRSRFGRRLTLDWTQIAVLAGGTVAWLVLLSQLGSSHSARNAAPYLPLLVFAASLIPPFGRFLRSKLSPSFAIICMLSVIPVLVLTPARPLFPTTLLERGISIGPVAKVLGKYQLWEGLRDDLRPMRENLPANERVIGYAGAFRDTSYGLWKPFGSRTLIEIGLRTNSKPHEDSIPSYVVATKGGIQQRFQMSLEDWANHRNKEIRFSFARPTSLGNEDGGGTDEWFLLGPKTDNHKD